MEQHNLSPKEVLEKHLSKNPRVVIIISLSGDDNQLTYDVSHPIEVSHLAIMAKFVEKYNDLLLSEKMGLA